jgi:hypothetical protein
VRAISQHIHGTMLTKQEETVLLLHESAATATAVDSLYLRFAFIIRGPEQHLFPALVLDDWGGEIRGLELYRWVRQYGEQFPRAEIFGYDAAGNKTQFFLRELELYARLPCYVYQEERAGIATGHLVKAILLPTAQLTAPVLLSRPPQEMERPLRAAHVSWWQVPRHTNDFDFTRLAQPPDPGF